MADYKAGEGKYKLGLKHLAVPESKEVLRMGWGVQKGPRKQLEDDDPNNQTRGNLNNT